MYTEVKLDISETPLRVLIPINTHVLDVERLLLDRSLEPLFTSPGHVLDSNTRSFRKEDHIRQSMHHDRPVRLFDDVWHHAQHRRDRLVPSVAGVDVDVGTVVPFDVRCVNRVLDVSSVEVDELLCRSRETEDAPGDGPLFRNAINIESRIKSLDFIRNGVKDPTVSRHGERPIRYTFGKWQHALWRICDELIQIIGVSARI